jgi:hypothetical protein
VIELSGSPAVAQLALVVALASSVVAGCSGSRDPELPGPGTTALYIENRVGGACELVKVGVAVDGRYLIQMKMLPPDIPAPGGDGKLLTKIPLAPGSHALSLQVSARSRGADVERNPEIVTLRDTRSFLVSEGPAAVVIEINSIELKGDRAARLDAKLRVRGAELAPSIGPEGIVYEGGEVDAAGVDDRLCAGLPAARRAICRAEAVLTRARERRDVVSVSCIQEKIAEMRLHAVAIDRAGERSQGSRDPSGEAQKPDVAVIAMAEERIQALALEIEYCSGHEAMDPEEGSGVRVIGEP